MNRKEAKNLFKKYLKNECSSEEIQLLHKFLESYQNDKYLDDNEFQKSKIWNNIEQKVLPDTGRNKFSFRQILRYAAIFIGLFGLVYAMGLYTNRSKKQIEISDDAIIVRTSGNRQLIIGQDENRVIRGINGKILGRQSKDLLVYETNSAKELIYNEILIPNGRNFKLKLSDGTFVHLNAGSSLRYPVSFIKGNERRVFLKGGEAYFEVAKDPPLNPFTVVANNMDVNVLGTHFNVSSYDDETTYAVLVEGSVEVTNTTESDLETSRILVPGRWLHC